MKSLRRGQGLSSILPIATLTGLALALRVIGYDSGAFRDEFFTLDEVLGHSLRGVFSSVANGLEVTPPFYFMTVWLVSHSGSVDWLMRLPSLLAGVALVPVVYGIGRRVARESAGLLAAGFVAIAPSLLYYSNELRPYMLLSFLLCSSTYVLLRAVDDDRGRWWFAYAALGALAMCTHYTAALILGVQALWTWISLPGQRRAVLIANSGIGAAVLPWLLVVHRTSTLNYYGPMHWRDLWFQVVETVPAEQHVKSSFLNASSSTGRIAYRGWLMLWWALALGATGAVVLKRGLPSFRSTKALLVLCAAAVPVGLAAASAIEGWAMLTPRHVVVSAPYVLILLAAVVVSLPARAARTVGVTLVAMLAVGTVIHMTDGAKRPGYLAVAQTLHADSRPQDLIIDAQINDCQCGNLQSLRLALRGVGARTARLTKAPVSRRDLVRAQYQRGDIWVLLSGGRRIEGPLAQRIRLAGYAQIGHQSYGGWVQLSLLHFKRVRRAG